VRAVARSLSDTPRVCAAAVRRVVLVRKLGPVYWCEEPAAGALLPCAGDDGWLAAALWPDELPVLCTHPATRNAAIVIAETIRIAKPFSVMITSPQTLSEWTGIMLWPICQQDAIHAFTESVSPFLNAEPCDPILVLEPPLKYCYVKFTFCSINLSIITICFTYPLKQSRIHPH
jgi:hypothetical protein